MNDWKPTLIIPFGRARWASPGGRALLTVRTGGRCEANGPRRAETRFGRRTSPARGRGTRTACRETRPERRGHSGQGADE